MDNVERVEDILDTYASSWGMGEDHPDYPQYLVECDQIEAVVDYLRRAPSEWLDKNIHKLAEGLSGDPTIFFSEDGKTALIMAEHGDKSLFVRLTKDEYATGGGKIFWAKIGREEFGVAKE